MYFNKKGIEKMKEKIEKPITVVRQEFIDKMYDTINNCNLPVFIIEPILRDLHSEVKVLSRQQYELDKTEYENKLKTGDDESK